MKTQYGIMVRLLPRDPGGEHRWALHTEVFDTMEKAVAYKDEARRQNYPFHCYPFSFDDPTDTSKQEAVSILNSISSGQIRISVEGDRASGKTVLTGLIMSFLNSLGLFDLKYPKMYMPDEYGSAVMLIHDPVRLGTMEEEKAKRAKVLVLDSQ